jgi:hypothetical protein
MDASARVMPATLRPRRQRDCRRTFRSLCLDDGARRDLLRWATHGRPGDVGGLYESPDWKAVCAEVAKLNVELHESKVIAFHVAAAAGQGSELGTFLGTVGKLLTAGIQKKKW